MRVSSAELVKRFGPVSDRALTEPVTITRNGRDRLVLLSSDEYARLQRRDRRVILTENLTDIELAEIEATRMSPEHDHLNELLGDWKP